MFVAVLFALRRRRETFAMAGQDAAPARGIRNPALGRFGSFFRTDKCRDGAPEGERVDRKTRERLRTVFRRVDRKIRQGRFASAQRFSALHSLIGGKEKGRATRGRHKNTGSEAMCARKASRYLKYFSIIFR
jgi:hypothetical protein